MADFIQKTDTLNEGREKINAAIQDAEDAKNISVEADEKATQALANSESTQTQLDTIVIDGDSSVEAAQARVDAEGNPYTTLKERLDSEHTQVTQQLAQKANEVDLFDIEINARQFGVVGDGVEDDTNSLKEALLFLKNGGTLRLPAGTFIISSELTIPKGVTIKGMGIGKTVIQWDKNVIDTSWQHMLIFEDNTGDTFSGLYDLTLDQQRSERNLQDRESHGALRVGRNLIVDKVEIRNTVGPGIHGRKAENITVTNSHIHNTGHHNVYFSTTDGTIRNIKFINNTFDTPARFQDRYLPANIIKLRFGNDVDIIDGFTFENNKVGVGVDTTTFYVAGSESVTVDGIFKNSKITNNYFNYKKEHVTRHTIYFAIQTEPHFLDISKNSFFGSGTSDVYAIYIGSRNKYNSDVYMNEIKGFENGIYFRWAFESFTGTPSSELSNIRLNKIDVLLNGISASHSDIRDNVIKLSDTTNAIGITHDESNVINNTILGSNRNQVGIRTANNYNKEIKGNILISCDRGITRDSTAQIVNCIFDGNRFYDCEENYTFLLIGSIISKNSIEPSIKVRAGTTSQRPIPQYIGELFFDMTLGYIITWNGNNWVNSEGTIV